MREEAGEDGVLLANVAIGRVGKTAKRFSDSLLSCEKSCTISCGRCVGGRLKNHRVDEAEDGGVYPDPEGEGEDRDDAEAGRFEEQPESEAKILDHGVCLVVEVSFLA